MFLISAKERCFQAEFEVLAIIIRAPCILVVRWRLKGSVRREEGLSFTTEHDRMRGRSAKD